jgi:flavin reductase (DIM6/NTAB) family NADH-FMN oxidoreductase RutF
MTALSSLTMDRSSLIACVNRKAGTHWIMSTVKRVSINGLPHDQIGVAELFCCTSVKGTARFEEEKWTERASGLPALFEALAVLDCEVNEEIAFEQHPVFFCEIKGCSALAGHDEGHGRGSSLRRRGFLLHPDARIRMQLAASPTPSGEPERALAQDRTMAVERGCSL